MARWTRREFLKIGLSGAAIAGWGGTVTSCFGPAPEPGRKDTRTTGKPSVVASTCLLCPAGCGILGEVIDGRLVKITGNPKHPNNHGRLCSRGHAGINTLYDPDRLLYPLKRSGARGEGRWTQISWDFALDEMAKRIQPLVQQGRTDALWFELGNPGSLELMALPFLKALGQPTVFQDSSFPQENSVQAWALTWGAEPAVSDVAQSRLILIFGANPYENHELYIPRVQRVIEGKLANSAKIITFDVRLSNTGGKSHEWFPVKPGTDGLLALAMAHHIVKKGLHDQAFLTRWTNVSMPQLVDHLSAFTPERAETECGVRAADIRRIAEAFAQAKPAATITGRGVGGHQNGSLNERCIALLNAVAGNIDIPGGCCLPRAMDLASPRLKTSFPSSSQALAVLKEGKAKAEMVFCYMANPAYANPGVAEGIQLLKDEKRVPFLVVADTHLTETGALADLLLPMTTYLESWNLETRPAVELVPFVSLRQPVVAPLGKTRPIGDLCLGLAKRLGGNPAKSLPFSSDEDFIAQAAMKLPGLKKDGGFDLLKKDGVWWDASVKPEYRSYRNRGFSTPSGKFEIFSKRLQEKGHPPLPTYVPIPFHQQMKDGEFILAVNRANVMTPRLANSKWLSEILHDNPLWINTETARKMGLRDDDRVKITSPSGNLVVRVRLSQGIHPQVVTLTEGLGHSGFGRIARGKKEKSGDFDTEHLWWEQSGNGVNSNTLLQAVFDRVGGGVAWNDTKVTVTKA